MENLEANGLCEETRENGTGFIPLSLLSYVPT